MNAAAWVTASAAVIQMLAAIVLAVLTAKYVASTKQLVSLQKATMDDALIRAEAAAARTHMLVINEITPVLHRMYDGMELVVAHDPMYVQQRGLWDWRSDIAELRRLSWNLGDHELAATAAAAASGLQRWCDTVAFRAIVPNQAHADHAAADKLEQEGHVAFHSADRLIRQLLSNIYGKPSGLGR